MGSTKRDPTSQGLGAQSFGRRSGLGLLDIGFNISKIENAVKRN